MYMRKNLADIIIVTLIAGFTLFLWIAIQTHPQGWFITTTSMNEPAAAAPQAAPMAAPAISDMNNAGRIRLNEYHQTLRTVSMRMMNALRSRQITPQQNMQFRQNFRAVRKQEMDFIRQNGKYELSEDQVNQLNVLVGNINQQIPASVPAVASLAPISAAAAPAAAVPAVR
jgi:hypothetical protein